jgi:hypothetical protein
VLKYIKAPALWLALGLVLGSGALSFAATDNGHGKGPKPKPSVSATADEKEKESADDQSEDKGAQEENANRKHNHGFFVSQAAHCENVSDTENSVEFTAPDNCDSNGKAHGGYVSGVAKSDAGKGAHGQGDDGSE